MQTIRTLTREIFHTHVITSDHVYHINTLLRQRQYDQLDEVAMRHLIQALLDGTISSSSPCLNLFLTAA